MCRWRHQILKSEAKDSRYIRLLLSSSIAYFVWKPAHFEFWTSYGAAWHKAKIAFVAKYIPYLASFSHFRSSSNRKNASVVNVLFGSVQIISRLASQNKFQMFTLFTGRHIGGPGSIILRWTFRRISQLWDNEHISLKLGELSALFIVYNITTPWLLPLRGFWFYFLLRENSHTL